MKVITEELEQCEVLLTVEVDSRQEKKMLEAAAKRIAKEIKIPGFRPGKAPYNIVIRRFGLEAVQQEALESSADKVIEDALKEAGVQPYAQIGLESIAWNPLVIKLKIPTKPKVEIGNYRDMRLEFEAIAITDDEINSRLEEMREAFAAWAAVDRPAEMGDLMTVALVEKDGDTVLRDDENVEYQLDPLEKHEGHNHPDWTTPLLGLSAGDEKTFTWTYPENADNPAYAGKEITVEIRVSSVKAKELDPLDDEFAMSISDFETLAALKDDIRATLEQERQQEQDGKLGQQLLDQLVAEATIIWPQAFEDESVAEEIERIERQTKAYGLTMDTFYQVQNTTPAEFAEKTRKGVVENLKQSLVVSKIIDLEGLTINQSEILAQAKRIADYSGKGEQVWRNILASEAQQNIIANDLLVGKAVRFLALVAKGEAPAIEAKELTINDDGESSGADDVSSADDVSTAAATSVEEPAPQADEQAQEITESIEEDEASSDESSETETDS